MFNPDVLLHHFSLYDILFKQLEGCDTTRFCVLQKGVGLMSTYEEFMVILTTGLFIIEILNLKSKK